MPRRTRHQQSPPALQLFPEPLPFARPAIPGFAHGDRVTFQNPDHPQLIEYGKVLAGLPHSNRVVVRAETRDKVFMFPPEQLRKQPA